MATTQASKRSFTALGQVRSGGRVVQPGEGVELTDEQAKRALKAGTIAEGGSKQALDASSKREKAHAEQMREALEEVPFTGNTAGQPTGSAPIPMNNTSESQIMSGPSKAAEPVELATGSTARAATPKTTGIKKR